MWDGVADCIVTAVECLVIRKELARVDAFFACPSPTITSDQCSAILIPHIPNANQVLFLFN